MAGVRQDKARHHSLFISHHVALPLVSRLGIGEIGRSGSMAVRYLTFFYIFLLFQFYLCIPSTHSTRLSSSSDVNTE